MALLQCYAALRLSNFCISICKMHTCTYRDVRLESSTLLTRYADQFALTFAKRYINHKSRGNYYDVLKITPKATQSQVKQAYYKLSLENHPDQHQGSAAATEKFRIITEAYQVLNNVQKRKLYDKGFFHADVSATAEEADAYSKKVSQPRKKTGRTPSTGRTPIYNFDAWQSAHYARKMDELLTRKEKAERVQEKKVAYQLQAFQIRVRERRHTK